VIKNLSFAGPIVLERFLYEFSFSAICTAAVFAAHHIGWSFHIWSSSCIAYWMEF